MTTTAIGQVSGNINAPDENDWYKVTLNAGTQYLFTVNSGTLSGNAVLTAYDANGNPVSTSASGSLLNIEPTSSGTYYIGITGASGATGSFQIIESSNSYDFAGNTSTAGALAIGSSVTGTLATAGQSDWFKVTLNAGQAYNFSVNGSSGAATVTLYNSSGAYVLSGNDGNTIAGNELTFTPTVGGTYYLAASDSQNTTGGFTLSAATTTQDFAGNVNTTGALSIGSSVTGTLANVGQSDWFKVTLTAGQAYVFNASGNGSLTPSVTVYNGSGTAIAEGFSGGANGGAQLVFEPTTSGTYFIGAGGLASTVGGFTLSGSTASPDLLGNTLTTGTLSVGGTATGNLTLTGQSDWFKVTLNAGSAYLFNVSGALGGPSVNIYDANGNQLIGSASGGANGGAAVLFEPTAGGTYYVGASGSGTGAFTVSATATTVDHLGTTGTTASISVGGAAGTGNIANPGQSDWFKVTLNAGSTYELTANGVTLSSPEVSLYNSAGTLVQAADGGGGQGSSVTTFQPTTSGTYYVGVSGQDDVTGTFSVSVTTTPVTVTGNPKTTGTFGVVLNAATAESEFAAHTLAAKSVIIDNAASIQSNLDGLSSVVASGLVSGIQLTDSSTPTITITASQVATDAGVLSAITSPYTLNISGYSSVISQFDAAQGLRYIPGTSHAGSDQVIEIGSVAAGTSPIALGSGFNAVIIDGSHSTTAAAAGQPDSFSFNVDANGTVTLHDNNTGNNVSITGDTYLIFNSAATNADGSYQSIYFVGGTTEAQVTSVYNASFIRQPDLGGLEFYASKINAGTLDLHTAATYFINSPEFQADYPAAALPADHGGVNDQAFIVALYNNVLHRTPDASEISFYANALAGTSYDRADLLEFFALSPENQNDISNFLVNTGAGAYADSNDLLAASTVLGEVTSGSVLNTAAISTSSVGSGVSANGISISTTSGVTLTASAPTETVDLSSGFSTVTVQNSGSTIVDSATANSTINLNGANNTTLTLGNGGTDTVNLLGGTNTTINGFVAGSGTELNVTNTTNPANVQILNGAAAKVSGASLSFGSGTSYVVLVGTVTDDSAASIATAANKAYAAADVNGTGTATGTGEFITFLAQDSSGNTQVWFWGSTAGANNGAIPASALAAGADTNGNHLVDAGELVHVATIVGVLPSALTASDLA